MKRYWKTCSIQKNLKDLLEYIQNIEEKIFNYHVNSEKNDFYNWINEVIKDKKLAKLIKKKRKSKAMYKTIKNRIDLLKRII